MVEGTGKIRGPENGDFANLKSAASTELYLQQLGKVFRCLIDCYPASSSENNIENNDLRKFLEKLAATSELLRYKYTALDSNERSLWVDVTESGLPNRLEISQLEVDAARKEQLLSTIPPLSYLKQALVDEIFATQAEPHAILRELGPRLYLERLKWSEAFLAFNEGNLTLLSESPSSRRYQYSFACYDFATNRPYLHFLVLDLDIKSQKKSQDGALEELRKVVRAEGSRAPALGLLAMSIDEGLDEVHPKLLKRLCLGPLYSKIILEECVTTPGNAREQFMKDLLKRYGRRDDDFVMLITEEIVFSKRQEVSRSMLGVAERRREIFELSEGDPECAERKASVVYHYYVMPHELMQHVGPQAALQLDNFSRAKKITIDEAGEIHGL